MDEGPIKVVAFKVDGATERGDYFPWSAHVDSSPHIYCVAENLDEVHRMIFAKVLEYVGGAFSNLWVYTEEYDKNRNAGHPPYKHAIRGDSARQALVEANKYVALVSRMVTHGIEIEVEE